MYPQTHSFTNAQTSSTATRHTLCIIFPAAVFFGGRSRTYRVIQYSKWLKIILVVVTSYIKGDKSLVK